jgi:hypothetical protein
MGWTNAGKAAGFGFDHSAEIIAAEGALLLQSKGDIGLLQSPPSLLLG